MSLSDGRHEAVHICLIEERSAYLRGAFESNLGMRFTFKRRVVYMLCYGRMDKNMAGWQQWHFAQPPREAITELYHDTLPRAERTEIFTGVTQAGARRGARGEGKREGAGWYMLIAVNTDRGR